MNFLQLVQQAHLECGMSGSTPSQVQGQTGQIGRLINWVNAAWQDIQTAHQDWDWLRKSTSVTTVAGQGIYLPADFGLSDFGRWDQDTMRNYVTSSGTNSEVFMTPITYDEWRDTYLFNANRNVHTRPLHVAISPAKGLCLGPLPDSGYTVTADYYAAPTDLVQNADTPALPTQFHWAIIYRAMMSYGMFEAAPEVYQRGELEFSKLMRRMTADRLPEMQVPGALA